jgi:hypothetical protein
VHYSGDSIEAEPVVPLARLSPSNGSVLRRWMVGIAALTPPYLLLASLLYACMSCCGESPR